MAPADFAVAGSFFLLREIEIAAARVGHVTLGADGLSVAWVLPKSKTDCRAVGVSRSWDCCCAVAAFRPACPVCALSRQLDRARPVGERLGIPVAELPLFFTEAGGEVSKAAAVGTIERLAELIGESLTGSGGCRRFGGHSLRTGGASMLAARGLDPDRIQAMGRWRSPLVLHYATEALSTGLASLVERQRPTVSTPAVAATEMVALRRLLTPVSYTHLTLPTKA